MQWKINGEGWNEGRIMRRRSIKGEKERIIVERRDREKESEREREREKRVINAGKEEKEIGLDGGSGRERETERKFGKEGRKEWRNREIGEVIKRRRRDSDLVLPNKVTDFLIHTEI